MEVLDFFLFLGTFLFSLGIFIVITKRNLIVVLIGLELIFNAANINLIAFSQYDAQLLQGQMFALFVMIIATAEAAIALAIVIRLYQHFKSSNIDEFTILKG